MEHKLILGGEEYLPFARSRIKALRATGLSYASQVFDTGSALVRVRIEGEQEYIHIEGNVPRIWLLVRVNSAVITFPTNTDPLRIEKIETLSSSKLFMLTLASATTRAKMQANPGQTIPAKLKHSGSTLQTYLRTWNYVVDGYNGPGKTNPVYREVAETVAITLSNTFGGITHFAPYDGKAVLGQISDSGLSTFSQPTQQSVPISADSSTRQTELRWGDQRASYIATRSNENLGAYAYTGELLYKMPRFLAPGVAKFSIYSSGPIIPYTDESYDAPGRRQIRFGHPVEPDEDYVVPFSPWPSTQAEADALALGEGGYTRRQVATSAQGKNYIDVGNATFNRRLVKQGYRPESTPHIVSLVEGQYLLPVALAGFNSGFELYAFKPVSSTDPAFDGATGALFDLLKIKELRDDPVFADAIRAAQTWYSGGVDNAAQRRNLEPEWVAFTGGATIANYVSVKFLADQRDIFTFGAPARK